MYLAVEDLELLVVVADGDRVERGGVQERHAETEDAGLDAVVGDGVVGLARGDLVDFLRLARGLLRGRRRRSPCPVWPAGRSLRGRSSRPGRPAARGRNC